MRGHAGGAQSGPVRVVSAAIFYKLIRTAKLNVFEPKAHPRDVLGRISKAPV
jgi:hypothetical protein